MVTVFESKSLVRRYCTVYCSVDIYCNKCNPPPPNKTRCPIAISHRLIDISRVCIVQHIETTRFYTRVVTQSGYTGHGHSLLGNCGQNEFSAFSFWIRSVQSYHQMADSRHRAASLAYNLYDIETWSGRRHAEIRRCGKLGNNWTDNKLVREKRLGRTSKLFIVYAWKLSIHISAHCRSCHSADTENLKLKTYGLKNFRIDDRW